MKWLVCGHTANQQTIQKDRFNLILISIGTRILAFSIEGDECVCRYVFVFVCMCLSVCVCVPVYMFTGVDVSSDFISLLSSPPFSPKVPCVQNILQFMFHVCLCCVQWLYSGSPLTGAVGSESWISLRSLQKVKGFVTPCNSQHCPGSLRNAAAKNKEPLALAACSGWVPGPVQRPGKQVCSSPWWTSWSIMATLPNPPMKGRVEEDPAEGPRPGAGWRVAGHSRMDQLHAT